MKVLVGHFGHEANTFAENKTSYADFIGRGIWLGEDAIRKAEGTAVYLGGIIRACREENIEMIPTCAYTCAAPTLTAECVEKMMAHILPALVFLLTAVQMLKSSGAIELLGNVLAPLFSFLGIPPETAMLVLIRPISGSAALAVGADLMTQYGVDSIVGRTVAVMLGSTETTFYTISVYFGAAGIRKTRYAVPAALFADLVGFTMASWSVRWLY